MKKTTHSKQVTRREHGREARAERESGWEFNTKLLTVSTVVTLVTALLATSAYVYQSSYIADSLEQRASIAAASHDYEKQIAWLKQVKILKPEDPDVALALADAAEVAAEHPAINNYDRVERARNLLAEASTILRKNDSDAEKEALESLERKIIARELQLGLRYANSVRRRIIGLNGNRTDENLLRAFAIAKHMLANNDQTNASQDEQVTADEDELFWVWLDQQPLLRILTLAWKAKPQDIELAGRLASYMLERPDSFLTNRSTDNSDIELALKNQLASMRDSGQATLILHSLLLPTDPEAAASLLDSHVNFALERLGQRRSPTNTETDSETSVGPNSEALPQTFTSEGARSTYEPLWDFNLTIAWARSKLQTTSPDHESIDAALDQLIGMPAPTIPARLIEETYLLRTRSQPDTTPSRIDDLLLSGINRLGIESARLQLQRAETLISDGKTDDATAAVQQLARTLQERRAELVGARGITLTASEKSAEELMLNRLSWKTNVLDGIIDNRRGMLENARRKFQNALRSQISVGTQQRLQATLLLADVYRKMRAWDLAAASYEAAIGLAPEQQELRALAADAWTSAGNVGKAFEQWRTLSGDSLALRVQQLRASIAEEFAQPPSRRDFEAIWRELKVLETQVANAKEKNKQEVQKARSELALLALAVPDRDDGSSRKSTIERLQKLGADYPTDAGIQNAAALSLAQAGKIEAGRECLQRLNAIESIDALAVTLTNAKFEATVGNLDIAIESLLAHAANNPDDVNQVRMLAAEYISSQEAENSVDKAYETLLNIPPRQHTPESCFRLFSYALAGLQMPVTSETDLSQLITAEQLLFDLDEPTGTWWKLAKAIRLLSEASNKTLNAEQRAELISEASRLSSEISGLRPVWGLGLSLAGQVAAARGEIISAIQSLQAGISNGDARLSSSYLLTQLLLQTNRVMEAEAEYSRFERLRTANSNIAAFGVSIAERKGEYKQSLELARQAAEDNDEDEVAWLLVAQAAMMAARSTDEGLAKDELLAEARRSLELALNLSNDSSVRAYQMRLRFQQECFGEEAYRAELAKLCESKVGEPTRSLLAGLGYLKIKDIETAFPLLKQAEKYAPLEPQVFIALSEYYQLAADNKNTIGSLERAFELAPNRIDIRSRLAIAIALRSGADIPWQRLDSLLDTDLIGDSQNKLLHALILLNRGNESQEGQAESILLQLVRTNDTKADDARRLLASLWRRRWTTAASIDAKSAEAQRALSTARGVYQSLINRENPRPLDIYRLGDLLLRAEQTQDVNALANQLDAITKGAPVALDLRLRLAQQSGDNDKIQKYAEIWANRAMEVDGLLQASVWETTGQLLSKLGYHTESIDWLKRAYEDDPSKFRAYILGLTRARRFDEAIEGCVEQYNKDHEPDTASALADVAVLMGLGLQARPLSDREEAVLQQALRDHPSDAALLEAVATMRLAQERYGEAIPLYKESARYSPNNVRLLNNLAMALSETSGGEAEAIPYATKAIELYGRSPELLDTLGLVLVRNRKYDEAEKVLREAVNASPDPRYRFHLLVALLEQDRKVEAISQWSQLDLDALRKAALTPAERQDLSKIQRHFEG